MTRDIAIVATMLFLAICNMVSSILTARKQDLQDARLAALEAKAVAS